MVRSTPALLLATMLAACGGGGGDSPSPCPTGQQRCGDACVDLGTSAAHCGSCGTACSATQACIAGTCGCTGGTSACGDACFDLQTSASHCGSCAIACATGTACSGGTCLAVCAPPEVACGIACANLSTSAGNCGRCGRACAGGATCSAGVCTSAACAGLLDVPGAPLLPAGGEAMAAGDLDGDGVPDLVIAHNAAVAVALASGGGRFVAAPPVLLPAGSWASAVVLAHLDGDTHLDLAVADRDGAVHVAMGVGDGTFEPPVTYTVASGADGIVAVDLDGDGHLDLAVSFEGYPGGVGLLTNDGSGGFVPKTWLIAGNSPSSLAAGDVNGDGLVDLVVSNRYGHPSGAGDVSLFLGAGSGAFVAEIPITTGGAPQGVALADLDGDGHLDLVVTSAFFRETSVLLGNGNYTFASPVSYVPGANDLAIADLDGDGHLDVALASGDILHNLGDGTGALAATSIGASTMTDSAVVPADLDGDGRVDLAYGSGLVALQRADGFFAVPATVSPGAPLDVGDVDGDLDPDVVVSVDTPTGDDQLLVLLGRGDGTFTAGPPVALAPVRWLARLADVNGDGRSDLVTFDGTALAVWLGDGAGGFAAGPSFTPNSQIVELLALDLDGDGRADLVTRDFPATPDSGSAVLVRRGRGDGTFDPPATVAGDATALAAADLDGDGAPDLVVGRRLGLSVDVLRNMGDGTFAPAVGTVVGDVVTGLAIGELDGDGVPDVVAASNPYGFRDRSFLATLRGLGGGALGAPVRFAAGSAPKAAILGDLDGDGRAELLYEPEFRSDLLLLRNAGDGTFAAPQPLALWESPVAVVDLDRDGRPDVLTRNTTGATGYGTIVLRTSCRP